MARATLNGLVADDGGEPCECWFEWGLTNSYGERTQPSHLRVVTGGAFSDTISNLAEATTYHYRAVAVNSRGLTLGNDQAFTTPEPQGPVTFIDEELLSLLEG